jgi:hypothetical protein
MDSAGQLLIGEILTIGCFGRRTVLFGEEGTNQDLKDRNQENNIIRCHNLKKIDISDSNFSIGIPIKIEQALD